MKSREYEDLRGRLVTLIKRDADLHQRHRYEQIGSGFIEMQSALKHGGDHHYRKLIVALKFWDAWILARNTDWLEYDHIPEALWGELAVGVAADLEADRDITDPRVLSAFDLTTTLELPKRYGPKREASPLDQTNFNTSKE